MPKPGPDARRDRRRAERRLETGYGWPERRARRGRGLLLVAFLLAFLAAFVTVSGVETFWWSAPFVDAGVPSWVIPVVLVLPAVLAIASRMRT